MPITFVATSALVTGTTPWITVTPPTTQTDDIMLVTVASYDNVEVQFEVGWNLVHWQLSASSQLSLTVAWKRCVGAEADFLVYHTTGNAVMARCCVYRGCSAGANVIMGTGEDSTALNTVATGTTVPGYNGLAVLSVATNDNINGFIDFRVRGVSSRTKMSQRFSQFGDSVGSGGNKIVMNCADVVLLGAFNGNFSFDTTAGLQAPAMIYTVFRPNPAILTYTNKVARNPAGLIYTANL